MNDDLNDRRLGRAVRSALGDIVASAPNSADPPVRRLDLDGPHRRRRPMLHLAAGLTATAGILGVVLVVNRAADSPTGSEATEPASATTGTAAATVPSGSTGTTTSHDPTTTAPPTAPTTAVVPILGIETTIPGDPVCGSATVPPGATDVQTAHGDIDGDQVDDDVTLYSLNDEWHVNATSSVTGKASDTIVTLDVHESATVGFEDIDYSLGAEPKPPVAIMVTGAGPNNEGIIANFTFLTLDRDYCVEQWIYRNRQDVDEPFQWVALQEPGHVTGMICEGAAGSRYYRLVDGLQNDDGSWRIINRVLTHDFTRALIEFPPEETVPDAAEIPEQYGDIVGCDHPPVGSANTQG